MQRWAITLDEGTRRRLKRDLLELGSEQVGPDGEGLLVFRDYFVALRVAYAVGTRPVPLEPETAAAAC